MKYLLYMHGGSGNHGCEALVRTTSNLIRKIDNSNILLWSGAKDEEYKYGADKVVDTVVSEDEIYEKNPVFVSALLKHKLFKNKNAIHQAFLKSVFKDRIAISIGGDNYCYSWSAKHGAELDKTARKYCKKNLFWGCSIEEEFLTSEVIEDLKGFDLITVRESLSYEVLKKHGINAERVSDSAFLLEEKRLPLPQGFMEGNTVGINLSPMINTYESNDNLAYKNYQRLIEYIINDTDMNICLIPHVVWDITDDRKPLVMLYNEYKGTNRVVMIEDCNCEELKGYISRCRFFIGARTHATIAAYSTCVPTLVMGYSIKAKGIAKDLFGTYEGYVVPVQSLKNESDLTDKFKFIIDNEYSVRNHLKEIMPEYKKKAYYAGDLLQQL